MEGIIHYKTPSRDVVITYETKTDRYQEKMTANNRLEGLHSYQISETGLQAIQTRFANNLKRIVEHGYKIVRAELLS